MGSGGIYARQPHVTRAHLLRGLTLTAAKGVGKDARLGELKCLIRRMQIWVKRGCVDCQHMLRLLEAEHARLKGKQKTVQHLYEEAIRLAGQARYMHDLALCHETCARFHASIGDNKRAAANCYSEWGADVKANRLYSTIKLK